MRVPTDEQIERVRELVRSVPEGEVTTYGDLAEAAHLPSPRMSAWIMKHDSSDLPWHRVVRADGTPAPHIAAKQLELLRQEGAPIRDGRVDMKIARATLTP
ncbi:MAG: MGMT family protein [Nocardiaceae bacterium]|nr:MGMT family protein [Nocardiaceae bacterium]